MGRRIGWVFIPKTDKISNISQIINDLFSTDYEEIKECEIPNVYFDGPNVQNIAIFKDWFVIKNTDFALLFFEPDGNEHCNTLYQYFEQPKLVFIVIQMDNPGYYGFALIENGEMKRSYFSRGHRNYLEQYGIPLSFEKNWLNGYYNTYYDYDVKEIMGTIENSVTKETIDIWSLEMRIVSESCKNFIGVDTWAVDFSEIRYFKLMSNNFYPSESKDEVLHYDTEEINIQTRQKEMTDEGENHIKVEKKNKEQNLIVQKFEVMLNNPKAKFWITFIVILYIILYYSIRMYFKI